MTKTELTPEALEFFRQAGKRGGEATKKKHGKDHLREISKRGGRAMKEKLEKEKETE